VRGRGGIGMYRLQHSGCCTLCGGGTTDRVATAPSNICGVAAPPCPAIVLPSLKESSMQFQALKQRHRQERDNQHPNLRLRLHRALSWLDRAEQADDVDGRFVFLWI